MECVVDRQDCAPHCWSDATAQPPIHKLNAMLEHFLVSALARELNDIIIFSLVFSSYTRNTCSLAAIDVFDCAHTNPVWWRRKKKPSTWTHAMQAVWNSKYTRPEGRLLHAGCAAHFKFSNGKEAHKYDGRLLATIHDTMRMRRIHSIKIILGATTNSSVYIFFSLLSTHKRREEERRHLLSFLSALVLNRIVWTQRSMRRESKNVSEKYANVWVRIRAIVAKWGSRRETDGKSENELELQRNLKCEFLRTASTS